VARPAPPLWLSWGAFFVIGGKIKPTRFLAGLFLVANILSAQESEPRRLVVRGLDFEGNEAIDDYTLRISIATSQSGAFARPGILHVMTLGLLGEKRYFDETEFRRDVLRMLLLYRRSGFLEARVDTVVRRTSDAVHIRFQITEGEPVRVRSIAITGAEAVMSGRELRRDLPLRLEDPFDRVRFLASADSVQGSVRDKGYPFAEVYRSFDVRARERVAVVAYDIVPGPAAVIEDVEVIGAREVDEDVVRRALSVRTGQPFSQRALYESQRQLYRMGLFDYVNVTLADSLPDAPDDSLVTVRVQVSEGRLRRVRGGIGLGSLDCIRTLASWTVGDFLGGGRTLDLSARMSKIGTGRPLDAGFENNMCWELDDDEGTERDTINYTVTAGVRFPYIFSPRNSASIAFSAELRSEFQAYLRSAIGANFAITREMGPGLPLTLSYTLSYGSTKAEPAIFCSVLNVCRAEDTQAFTEPRVQSTLGLAVVRDRSNSPLNPTRGNVLTAQLRHASDVIGSDTSIQFTKGVAEFASYHPVGRQSLLAWRVRLGTIFSPRVGGGEQLIQSIPTEERFYAGGPTTVRGFRQNELGAVVRVIVPRDTVETDAGAVVVTDTLVSPTGGNQLLVANAELRFPLSGRLAGALFVDAGQVFERGDTPLSTSGIRVTPGVGFRFLTPLGPIRLDIAYNGYPPQKGPLFEEREGAQLELLDPDYAPDQQDLGFVSRYLQFNFSIGQAF
jgi:outer membrane protein assembly complex protein YaeT